MKRASRALVVEGTPAECFEAVMDFETYPEWQDAVHACEVRTRDGAGRGRRVSFEIDAKLRSFSYTLDYSYREPHAIDWAYVAGDVRDVSGGYTLEDQGDGTTLATYSLGIDPGFWVPGKVVSLLTNQVMQRSVQDLKDRVERR